MSFKRGDVVLVNFPFSTGGGAKVRPALIIQNDLDNRRLNTTIIAQITSRTDRASKEASQLLIPLASEAGKQSGLRTDSCLNCLNVLHSSSAGSAQSNWQLTCFINDKSRRLFACRT